MARIDKSQSGAKEGVGSDVDRARSTSGSTATRSKVGLERAREGEEEIEAGDLSAFDGRATNVAARPAGTRGQRTRRGSVDETDRPAARADTQRGARARAPAQAQAEGPTPRPPSPMGKATPGQGTSTRPVRAGQSRREDLSIADAQRDDRATKSAAVRGTAARPARATRGGDKREGTLDRGAGGARRPPTPRATGPKKGRGASKGAGTGGRGATS